MKTEQPLLAVRNLTKIFATNPPFVAVNNISFSVYKGEIVALLGANGAGKTTTLHMLLNALTPTSGSIEYFGKELATHASELLQSVAFASTYSKMPGNITVQQNLQISGMLYGLSNRQRAERITYWLKKFDLLSHRHTLLSRLSAGQITRVMLARAFMTKPALLFLDEPTASLDPDVSHEVLEFIKEQSKSSGLSVIITSHDMSEVSQIADRVLVMQKGSLITEGTPQSLAYSTAQEKLTLTIDQGLTAVAEYVQKHSECTIEGNTFTASRDALGIAQLLQDFARLQITYLSITLEKPTLHDYFLQLLRANSTKNNYQFKE